MTNRKTRILRNADRLLSSGRARQAAVLVRLAMEAHMVRGVAANDHS